MGFSFKGYLYRLFIDPLVNGLRRHVAAMVFPGEKVIDIACGTGALSLAMARHADHVTGIDFSDDMITTARRTALRSRMTNVSFRLLDATDLSCYPDLSFDVAVSTLAMHQFEPETAVKVLAEMRRLAKRVIIADYNSPMTPGPAAWLAWGIERVARGDHYRNFRKYMARGGPGRLAAEAGLTVTSGVSRGEGVFIITEMSSEDNSHSSSQ